MRNYGCEPLLIGITNTRLLSTKGVLTRRVADGGINTNYNTEALRISSAIPYLFNYTLNPNIPKTSNSIESFLGHLKDVQRLHRGLSREHFVDFTKWYLFFQSNKDKLKQNRRNNNLFLLLFFMDTSAPFGNITIKSGTKPNPFTSNLILIRPTF